MKTCAIPNTDLKASRIAYGNASLGGSWDDSPISGTARSNASNILRAALDCGINFFDHADIYCRGKSESLFGEAIGELTSRRDSFIVQTKTAIRPGRYDFSYEHITTSVEGSLQRLRTDYIDILLLHRPDALAQPDEVARAFDQLHASGKVRYFGVSNHTSSQIELLQASLRQPLVANQLQLSLVHTGLIDAGVDFNQGRSSHGIEGTLDYCRLKKIMIQAWSPMAHGKVLGKWTDATPPEAADDLARVVGELAKKKNVSKDAIAIAWLLRHPAPIQPILGTMKPERLAAACQADGVELSHEEWYRLYVAGRGRAMA